MLFVALLIMPNCIKAQQFQNLIVEAVDTSTGAASAETRISPVTFARRADGSWAVVRSTSDYPDRLRRDVLEIADFERMVFVHTEPLTYSFTTRRLCPSDVKDTIAAVQEFRGCNGAERISGLPHRMMLGYQVVEVIKEQSGYREVKWVAPALGCLALERTEEFNSGALNTHTVLSVRQEEPPPSLFQAPKNYTEHSPAEIHYLWSKFTPAIEYLPQNVLRLAESRYQLARYSSCGP